MTHPDYPGFSEVACAAIQAESLAAALHMADAMLVPNAPKDYRRHLTRALATFDEIAKRVETIRAELARAA